MTGRTLALGAVLVFVAAGAGWWTWLRPAPEAPAEGPLVPPLTGEPEAGLALRAVAPELSPVLLVSSARAGWDAQVLEAYGWPAVAVVAPQALGDALPAASQRVVVSDEALPEGARERLQRHVREGGWVVELGPRPGVCGAPAQGFEPGSRRLEGPGLDGVRFAQPVARLPSCDEAACEGEVLHWARDEAGARPFVVATADAPAGCLRFLADLTAAMQRMRQGNPALAGRHREGRAFAKPADLFTGELEAADYDVPRVDRLGYRLSALIALAPGPDVLVDPLPAQGSGLLLYTADQDYVAGPGVLIQSQAAAGAGLTFLLTAADHGSPPDIIYPRRDPSLMAPRLVSELARRGHGVGIHPSLITLPASQHAGAIARLADAFERAYGARPRVVRNHHLRWEGYVEMARHQAAAGLRMNLDFVSNDHGSGARAGFMTGSGLPLRFSDVDFGVLPIYQQPTQIDDSALANATPQARPQVLREVMARTRALLDVASREHVPLTVLLHPAWWFEARDSWQVALLKGAAQRGLSVWGAERWLSFVQARAAVRLAFASAALEVHVPGSGVALLWEGGPDTLPAGSELTALGTVQLGGASMIRLAAQRGVHRLPR